MTAESGFDKEARMWTKGRIVALAAAVVVPAALTVLFWRATPTVGGWAAPKGAAPATPPYTSQAGRGAPSTEATAEALFQQNCARCHGANLEGSANAPALRQSHWPYAQNRELLTKVIHQGRGLTMPGFEGKLSNKQIEALSDYLQRENGAQ